MNCFISKHTDVYYNLALEEFLLKQRSEDFFFLWRSEPVAVVGKHQNPYKELDYLYTVENGIKVARRLSGGGTVYQDLGNVNFTIIKNTAEGKQINLKQHSKPIFNALRNMGLLVEYSKRNDLLIEGKKFSGNAEHIYKNRVLHHGTLLFDSDLDVLEAVIKAKSEKYQDKTIASVRSKVTNIKSYFSKEYTVETFQEELLNQVVNWDIDFMKVEEPQSNLDLTKYNSDEWIFDYTPKYKMENHFLFDSIPCSIQLEVQKGEIIKATIDGVSNTELNILEKALIGQKHRLSTIKELLAEDMGFSDKMLINFF